MRRPNREELIAFAKGNFTNPPKPKSLRTKSGTPPLSPPSAPAQRRLQGPPAKRNFLAVSEKEVKFCRVIESQASQVPFY